MTDNKMERYKVKKAIKDLVKNINETTHIPAITEDDIFELFQLDSIADLRKVSRNFLKLSKILDHFSTATEIATSEKEGIVKFGIENGNAVDVKDWIKGIGGVIGGYVSKVSNKEAGKWYLNDLTDGKIYKCIQNHTSTSFDTTKYLDISNYGLSDKLENLYKVQQTKLYVHAEAIGQGRTTCNIVQKCGNIVTIIFDSGNALRNINDNTVIFQVPDGFKPKTFLSVNASQYNTSNGTVYIESSGIGKWKGATVNSASIIFTVSYIVD